MNKITKKQNSLYCDNEIRNWCPSFKATPKMINDSNRGYHKFYDKNVKKHLGKGKYRMTDERFWMILDKYEIMDEHGEFNIPEAYIDEVVREITTYDKTFASAEADAKRMWRDNVPERAKKLLIEHYTSKK